MPDDIKSGFSMAKMTKCQIIDENLVLYFVNSMTSFRTKIIFHRALVPRQRGSLRLCGGHSKNGGQRAVFLIFCDCPTLSSMLFI